MLWCNLDFVFSADFTIELLHQRVWSSSLTSFGTRTSRGRTRTATCALWQPSTTNWSARPHSSTATTGTSQYTWQSGSLMGHIWDLSVFSPIWGRARPNFFRSLSTGQPQINSGCPKNIQLVPLNFTYIFKFQYSPLNWFTSSKISQKYVFLKRTRAKAFVKWKLFDQQAG